MPLARSVGLSRCLETRLPMENSPALPLEPAAAFLSRGVKSATQ